MHFCFIDEAGDSQAIPEPTANIQPLLVITAVFIDGKHIKPLTSDFINLKLRFFPQKFESHRHDLDVLITEIKGDDIRKAIRDNPPNHRIVEHRLKYIDAVLALMKKYDMCIVSRIWVKRIGVPLVDRSVYTLTTQQICTRFQEYLSVRADDGLVIADYRDPGRNKYVAHSIFTQKNKQSKGDAFPSIIEIPTFGISNNHACLQIADMLCSTLIFPMAAQTYCKGHIENGFVNRNYENLKSRYKKRLKRLQFHFKDLSSGMMYWGITAEDPLGEKKGADLFV